MKTPALLLAILCISCQRPVLKVTASKPTLLANGYDTVLLNIHGPTGPPRIELSGVAASHQLSRQSNNDWRLSLSAGVMPGALRVNISANRLHWKRTFQVLPQTTDTARDGTPDFQRLEESADTAAFRNWLTYLAESEYFLPQPARAREITDCSALIRYAYREALRQHDGRWLAAPGPHLPGIPHADIRKYSFPYTLLGARLFRTRAGPYSSDDLTNNAFAEFADARTLQRFNTFFISRDVAHAQPGDILFYRRATITGLSYHSMIFLGPSRIKPDGGIYVVYHTGPDGASHGEIRRLNLTQLLHFPDPQWQAIAANPQFLGVYRWNILKVLS